MKTSRTPAIFETHRIGSILALAVAFKLALILWMWNLVYGDVNLAIRFGRDWLSSFSDVSSGPYVINSKTALGPILWYWIHARAGIPGLKAVNLACFLALFAIHYLIGRRIYSRGIVGVSLILFSFYVGTNLNVVAGEQDDMISALWIAAGVLLFLERDGAFLPSLLMGAGFLFKFSTAVFWLGFAAYLLVERRWKAFLLSCLGMAAPFLVLSLGNILDGFESLTRSLEIQRSYSTWGEVGFKLVSTGMIFSALISSWVVTRGYERTDVLFFFLSTAYLLYVLAMRDAYSAGYVMMACMFFSSFLIAEFLQKFRECCRHGGRMTIVILSVYLLATTAVTVHNLLHDTCPVRMEP